MSLMFITITYMPAVLKTFRKQTLGNEKSVPNCFFVEFLKAVPAMTSLEVSGQKIG